MKLGQRIQFLRIKHNMTQKELGNPVGVSTVSVGGWECGSRNPSVEAIIALAKIFNVTTDYLLGVNVEPEKDELLLDRDEKALLFNYRELDGYGKKAIDTLCSIEKLRVDSVQPPHLGKSQTVSYRKSAMRYIPRYITPSAAGLSAPLDGVDFEMILVDNTIPEEADFAVRIQGDSMSPYIHDGDTVYVKMETNLAIGDVGIFCVNGAMYCKQYYVDKDKNLVLISANHQLKHTNIVIKPGSDISIKCHGKVLLGYNIVLPDYIYEI